MRERERKDGQGSDRGRDEEINRDEGRGRARRGIEQTEGRADKIVRVRERENMIRRVSGRGQKGLT